MKCPRCSQDNPARAKFCLECGARLPLACRQCGTELPADAKFCLECGEPITTRLPAETPFESPDAYIPKHLAERILAAKKTLEGARKQVTVLFADIKGSTGLIAGQDPEEADKLLHPALERMMEAVHRYEGTVTRVTGDGIMALFGAPLAHEDHASRACFAALVMQEATRRYSEQVRREHGFSVQIRVGLNSGEVVVRSIGNDLYMEYTAMGQTTHLAARMEQLADPGSILLPADTLRLTEGCIEVKELGRVPVKGLPEPIEVYELSGAGFARRRFDAAAARGLTQFVGRDTELDHLQRSLERAGKYQGQIVAVVGEPAVGKSRLFFEFTHSHRTRGWLVLETSSVSYGTATPFLPVIDLLKTYFQIEARDEPRRIREKIGGKLVTLDESLMAAAQAFFALLHVPANDAQWEALDSTQRRQRTFDACKRLLLWESRIQPLLLVFEDLHWVDSETQAFLDSLVDSLPTARVLLLVNYRPEYEHTWGNRTCYTQLRIDPLPPDNAEKLLDALLGVDAGLRSLKELLIEQTQGNPFFLEESIRSLVETEALIGEPRAYRLAKPLTNIQVPPTVQAVLAARIDRLRPSEKRLLETASVIGETVPFALLQLVSGMPEEELRHTLRHLQIAELLYQTSLFPDLEYTFKHGLTYQVAYNSLLTERRRALHTQILEAIENLYSSRLIEHSERLAHHAFRGEVWAKALTYLRQAGAKAETRSAYREAVSCFEQALTVLNHLPKDRPMLEQAVDVRFDLRTSLFPLGEHQRVLDYLREAEILSGELDDQLRQAWVSVYMCHYRWVTGQSAQACDLGRRARSMAETLGDVSLTVTANYYLGLACLSAGDYQGAEVFLRENVGLLRGDLARKRLGVAGFPAAMSRSYLAWALAERGEFDEGIVNGQEAVLMAKELEHAWSFVTAAWGLASLYTIKGEPERALEILERALALSREWYLAALTPGVMGSLGYAQAMSGRLSDGLSMLAEAVAAAEASGRLAFHSVLVVYQGEVLLRAERLADARTTEERALALARERGERGVEAAALRLLGEIASRSHSRERDKAVSCYGAAMELAGNLGMRPLTARCHLGLARMYRRAQDRDKSEAHFGKAAELFRGMGMRVPSNLLRSPF